MTIRVQGVLKNPLGQVVANVPIKVVTTSGFGDVLTTAEAIYFTDGLGNYDFNLEFATHDMYVMFTDTYELLGTTVANASVPTPTTISDLLFYTTPLPNDNEQCIRDDFSGCIGALESAWDTCIVQLSTQVAQGDTGVCQAMTTYTNDRLAACSAEMTTYVQAGDAFTLQESQAYADDVGTQITCCTNLLDTRLSSVCSTLSAYTASNDLAIANLCTDLQAGDAQVLQQAQAYSDVCNGVTCANLTNMIQACDAAVYTCMSVLNCCIEDVEFAQNTTFCQPNQPTTGKPGDVWYDSDDGNKPYYMNSSCVWTVAQDGNIPQLVTCTSGLTGDIAVLDSNICNLEDDIELQQAGYDIVTSAGSAVASISLLATSFTNTDVQCSEILMRADKIAMHNGDATTKTYPFYVTGNNVYMSNAYIQCLTGDKILSNTTIVAGSGTTRAGMNGDDSGTDTSNRNRGYRFWAGGEFARSSTGVPCAPFRVTSTGALVATNAYITGCINTTCLVFNAPTAVPPEITNACNCGVNACTKAVSACNCGINCGDAAKTCATTANNKAISACTCGINCGNAAKACAVAEGNAACTFTENRIYPCQDSIQIRSGVYTPGVAGWAIDCNGNAEFNNVVVRGTGYFTDGVFDGTVYAEHISGDIVSARLKDNTNTVTGFAFENTWCDLKTMVTVQTNRPYPRHLQMGVTDGHENFAIVFQSNEGFVGTRACVRLVDPNGNVVWSDYHTWDACGGLPARIYCYTVNTINAPVAANTGAGDYKLQVASNRRLDCVIYMRCLLDSGNYNITSKLISYLFKNSNDLV